MENNTEKQNNQLHVYTLRMSKEIPLNDRDDIFLRTLIVCSTQIAPYCTNHKWFLVLIRDDYETKYNIQEDGEINGSPSEKIKYVTDMLRLFYQIAYEDDPSPDGLSSLNFDIWGRGSMHVEESITLGITEHDAEIISQELENEKLLQYVNYQKIPKRAVTKIHTR